MRRYSALLLLLIFTLGCRALSIGSLTVPTPTILPTHTARATQAPTPSATFSSTAPPSPSSTSSPLASPTPSPRATEQAESFHVQFHPDGGLYIGDLVSLEIIAPPGFDLEGDQVEIQIDDPAATRLPTADFDGFGIQGRPQATLIWAWDTQSLQPGDYTLTFAIPAEDMTWTETVTLQPGSDLPPDEAEATWVSDTIACCTLYYMTNTAAERDLETLGLMVQAEAEQAIEQMEVEFTEPITITFLPRLLGHGGFAGGEIHVSYLDRNYAVNDFELVVHHELVHILDGRLGGELRPSILTEGLAVYLSGGHYRPEALLPRAAALLDENLGWYQPLEKLADDFYASQHEIGYLEAGALVAYMVDRWGRESFEDFYRDIHPHESELQSRAIDAALGDHFGITLAELESNFIETLRSQADGELWREDVRLTVEHFEALRRYQQALDPSAYFRTAWLLDTRAMRQRGIIADYYRHPSQVENLVLETLLVASGNALDGQQYSEAEQLLEAVNRTLDALEAGAERPFTAHPLAADYYAIVQALLERGYQAQQIKIKGDTAWAAGSSFQPEMIEFKFTRSDPGWTLAD